MVINDIPEKDNTNIPMKKSKLQYVAKNKAVVLIAIAILAILVSFFLRFIDVRFFLDFPLDFEWAVKSRMNNGLDWLVINGAWFFDTTSYWIKVWLGKLKGFLQWMPWPIFSALLLAIAWKIGGRKIALLALCALFYIGVMDLWDSAMITVAIMLVSVSLSIMIGLPLGVLGSRSETADKILKPILDGMQTMPSFVYLVPGIMFFGLGNVSAIIATVLYSIPPCIRLTNLGIRQVDYQVIEAGTSFGSNRMQLLTKIQIPLAIPTIMAGINQTIMMALAMSTIAAMVGAGGLGQDVLLSMGQLDQGGAFIAGMGIVLMAIIIDRITQGYIESSQQLVTTRE
jgi:glycine betaine/proline transport system permease protein